MSGKKKDYEVGFGKPPKSGQFQQGQSGNPRGRKKGARGLKTDLKAELSEKVTITENGKSLKLSKQRLMIKQLVAKAGRVIFGRSINWPIWQSPCWAWKMSH